MKVHTLGSLVPRPSHALSSFDRSQHAKTKDGRPGTIYHLSDINVWLGRQRKGGAPSIRALLRLFIAVSIQALSS